MLKHNKALLRWGFFLYIYFFFFSTVLAQYNRKIYNEWYFTRNNKLEFNSFNPISSLQLLSNQFREAHTTICDTNGKMLFVYDGLTLFNKNHQIVSNADTIDYARSSFQGNLFLPLPGNDSLIYLFVVKDADTYLLNKDKKRNRASYTIINKNLNNGLGGIQAINGVLQKKIEFGPDTTMEIFTAIQACGYYWILLLEYRINKIYAFKFDSLGFDTIPVISQVNSKLESGFGGGLKFKSSLDGKLLLFSDFDPLPPPDWGRGYWDWMEFDKQTGKVISSTKRYFPTLTESQGSDFGAGGWPTFCFSPNDSLIYYIITKHFDFTGNENYNRESQIIQLERYAADIVASRQIVARYQYRSWIPDEEKKSFRNLQIGPDGKIYVKCGGYGNVDYERLGVIHKPNLRGIVCDFDLDNGPLQYGTPEGNWSFVHYVDRLMFPDTIRYWVSQDSICTNKSIKFTDGSLYNAQGWYWEFGDGTFSTERNPTHIYTQPGTYEVSLSVAFECSSKTTKIPYKIHVGNCPVAEFTYSVTDSCNVYAAHIVSNSQYAVNQEFKIDNKLYTDSVFTHTFTQNGTYVVALKVKNQFGQDSISKTIEINNPACESSLFVPNIFTPNGDNINDTWYCTGEYITQFEATIFNRWGQQVFATQDISQAWDANSYSDGVYFLILKAQGLDGKVYEHKGFVQVVR
jgi:PKD repeat protein